MHAHRSYLSNLLRCATLALSFPAASLAQTTQPDLAKSGPPDLPLLQQLNAETESLFVSVKRGMVVVELPPPRWIVSFNDGENPVQKLLSPEVRRRVREAQERSGAGEMGVRPSIPATQPDATQPSVILQFPEQVGPHGERGDAANVKVEALVLDEAGHVLLPIFVDRDTIGDRRLPVIGAEGEMLTGRFIGSDRQSGLTVLQLDRPSGKPLVLGGGRPAQGSLVMLFALNGESGRLNVWTGELQEWAIAVGIDGTMHGFVRPGQFLCAKAIRPLAEELVRDGVVRRAALGVVIMQADAPNGQRALRVMQVIDHSAAEAAGLKEGDFICSFAGTAVSDPPSFSAAIAESNGRVDLMILRDEHPLTVAVDLRPQ